MIGLTVKGRKGGGVNGKANERREIRRESGIRNRLKEKKKRTE